MSIAATPANAPYPVTDYLKPNAQERSEGLLANCGAATVLPCRLPIQVGLFFDGTNNNMERDRSGQRVPVPWSKDELKWPVRWADTRILPALLETMTPAERTHLLSPLHAWITVDRQGEIIQRQGKGNPHPESLAFDCWPLDDARFSHLVGEAEADAVIGALYETQSDLFDAQSPAANHACVKRHLALATQNGIAGAGARRHLAMLALSLNDNFSTHPAFQGLLKRIREGADYQTEVTALPADFWQQCAKEN